MSTPFPYANPPEVISSERFRPVAITSDHTFAGTRPRALWVNNSSATTLRTLSCRAEGETADADFICGPGGTLIQISPLIIRANANLTVVGLW